MKSLFDSLVRTFTPIIVGAVIGWFVAAGITLDPEFEPALIIAVTAVFQGIYYVAVRLFEQYVSPKFGWLLGMAKQPAYLGEIVTVTSAKPIREYGFQTSTGAIQVPTDQVVQITAGQPGVIARIADGQAAFFDANGTPVLNVEGTVRLG